MTVPPTCFRVARWSMFAATVALSIGMLALLDQRLTGQFPAAAASASLWQAARQSQAHTAPARTACVPCCSPQAFPGCMTARWSSTRAAR